MGKETSLESPSTMFVLNYHFLGKYIKLKVVELLNLQNEYQI